MKKIFEQNDLILIGSLVILAVVLFLFKDKIFGAFNKSQSATNKTNDSMTSKTTPTKPPVIAGASIDELKKLAPPDYVAFNPHFKGIWRTIGTNNYITEPYSGKTYKKDSPIELFGANKKYGLYYVKYKGDMCWFPNDQIAESGPWPLSAL